MTVRVLNRRVCLRLDALVEKRESLWYSTYTTDQDICAFAWALKYPILTFKGALQMLGCIPRSPSRAIEISDDEDHEPVVRLASNRSGTDNSTDESDTRMALRATSSNKLRREIEILKVIYILSLRSSPPLTLSQTRIIDLERSNVKTEVANAGTAIKHEVSIKREREEDTGKQRSNQRRRTSVKIDLTDD